MDTEPELGVLTVVPFPAISFAVNVKSTFPSGSPP